MTEWKKLELSAPKLDAAPIQDIVKLLKAYISAMAEILEVLLDVGQVVADPISTAIKTLIQTLNETIKSLMEDVGIYFLYVPIKKRLETNLVNLNDITPPLADKLGIFGQPESAANWNNPNVAKFLVNANRYSGGNAGFFSTVVGSLDDRGDIMRPQFVSKVDYIAGITLVMGTNVDLIGFLQDLWTFQNMFHLPVLGAMNQVAAPKGLRGRALSRPVNGKFDVFLQWDHVDVPLTTLTDLGGIILYPVEVAILRVKNDVAAMTARSATEIFGQNRLNEGLVFGDADVVKIFPFNAGDTTYIDTDVLSDGYFGDDIYYYAVAWRFKAFKGAKEYQANDGTVLDYWQISNVVEIIPDPARPGATPPDWHRTPRISDLFPGLAHLIYYLTAQINAFAAKFTTALDMASAYIEFLKSEVDRYDELARRLTDLVGQMALNFDMPTAGIYARAFKGKGGNTFFVTDLANSLSEGFPSAPPFHQGDEYVTGAILLAGGPLGVVSAFEEAIGLMFGSISSGLNTQFSELEEQIALVESITFNDQLAEIAKTPEVTSTNDADNIDKIKCCTQPDETVYSFNDNFQEVKV